MSSGELELAAMQACYVQLKQLVPTVPLNVELSSLQLLQHVIDYIVDLEVALRSSASASSPQRLPQQQLETTSSCVGQKTTIHSNDQQSSYSASSASSTEGLQTSTPDMSRTPEISDSRSPSKPSSRALRDT